MLCLPHGVNLSLCKGAHLRISDFMGTHRNHTAMQVSSCALQPLEFATDFFQFLMLCEKKHKSDHYTNQPSVYTQVNDTYIVHIYMKSQASRIQRN